METISPTIPSTVTSERFLLLLLALAVVVVVWLALASCACFLASLARRLRSASLLPLATRPGLLAGFVCGGSAVTRAGVGEFGGVGAGVGSSGIVSSGCEAIAYIEGSEFCNVSTTFLLGSCQIPVRFLLDSHFIKAFEWITFLVSAGVRGWCCVVQVQQVGLRFRLKLDVFGCDKSGIGQGQPAPATQSNAPGKGGELVVDDVVVLEVLLQLLDIINLHHQAQAFADEHEERVDQGLGGLAADVGFLPFVVLLHIFIRQALDLLMGELHADGLFGLAGRNEDCQLLTFGGNVVARCNEIRYPCGLGGVRSGLQQLHDFVQSFLLLCGGHGIYVFSAFNNPFYLRQKYLQLPDNPRHGVLHGIQSQGVAFEQTRGFDNCVFRLKGVGEKPVQKLKKHSKLVQAGGRVHAQCICVCLQIRARCDTESHTGTAGRRPGGRICAS